MDSGGQRHANRVTEGLTGSSFRCSLGSLTWPIVGWVRSCNGMAKPRPSSAGGTDHGGAGQAVVELCDATPHGMVFWTRQRFEIGVELQVRLRTESLPDVLRRQIPCPDDWTNLRGYVVQCQPERRPNGSFGFRVSLLLASFPRATRCLPTPLAPTDDLFFQQDEGLSRYRVGKN